MKTIKKIGIVISLIAATAAMTACSTLQTTVIPQSQNKFTVVATAEDSSTAINGAIKKAQSVCTNQGKSLTVTSHQTHYQGAGKTLGAISSLVSTAAFMNDNVNVPSTQGTEDYKSTVVFECQ